MADESHTFGSTRARLEEIVTQVRKKDTSLEKSLDLLEEGVRLANACTELIDHQDWGIAPPAPTTAPGSAPAEAPGDAQPADAGPKVEDASQTRPPADEVTGDAATWVDGLRDGAPDESFDAALTAWSDETSESSEETAGTEDSESHDSEASQ